VQVASLAIEQVALGCLGEQRVVEGVAIVRRTVDRDQDVLVDGDPESLQDLPLGGVDHGRQEPLIGVGTGDGHRGRQSLDVGQELAQLAQQQVAQ
jgi:hypothetical protein